MAKQVQGSIVAQDHPNAPRRVSGAKLWHFAAEMRRRGYTCHFGADRDPKKVHCS